MNYEFEYNSPVIGKIQSFEYSYAETNEYAFTYGRDISSDLSKYNAPIFVEKKRRGVSYYPNTLEIDKSPYDTYLGKVITIDNVIKDIVVYNSNKNANVYKNMLLEQYIRLAASSEDNIVNILKDYLVNEYEHHMDYQTGYFAHDYVPKKISITKIKYGHKEFHLDVYDNYFLSEVFSTNISIKDTLFAKTSINNLEQYNLLVPFDSTDNILNVYSISFLGIRDKLLKVYSDKFLFHDIKNRISPQELINVQTRDKILNPYKQHLLYNKKYTKDIFIKDALNTTKKILDKMFVNNIKSAITIRSNDLLINKNHFCGRTYRTAVITNKILKLAKYKIRLLKSRDIILGYHPRRKKCFRKENLFVYKFNLKDCFLNTSNKFLYKDSLDIDVFKDDVLLNLSSRDFNFKDTTSFMKKNKLDFSINNTEYSVYRESYGFRINNGNIIAFNTRNGLVIDDSSTSLYKDRYSSIIYSNDAIIEDFELPTTLDIHNNTLGFVIPTKKGNVDDYISLSKNQYHIFKDSLTDFMKKEMITNDYSKFSIFHFTKEKEAFIDYYNTVMLQKQMIDILSQINNNFVAKNDKNAIINHEISFSKGHKEAFINTLISFEQHGKNIHISPEHLFISKGDKECLYYIDKVFMDKRIKETMTITDYIWINKRVLTSKLFSYETINKDTYEVFINENNLYIDKCRKGFSENDINVIVDKENNNRISIHEDIVEAEKHRYGINSKEFTFITKEEYLLNPNVMQISSMKKTVKDLEKNVEKTYNWAYVYQYEDPIDPNYEFYGLDELLLPEKDVKYEAFEDVIFDKKTMQPIRPVKDLGNNTFIAKYPIKHPTPDYEKIGIEYIDVPTELMRNIFTKFYQVWYANIFKFGNMSMVDSLKMMLDYMYSYIILTYSGSNYLEQALRVFRQIRWFGETSVLHNAQYKISYEYEDLKSDLHTGECNIKNTLNNFSIDKDLKVLSAIPEYFGQEADIKLYINNTEDTTISFSISFVGGNVEILLNDELIDVITNNRGTVSYDFPTSGEENEFIIRRTAASNIGICYVGNIKVKNGTYKNLSIEYDPDLKAGNMPLSDVVNKMVILSNMYENQQEVFEQFRKGNLAVSELYKKMSRYWELHHANKDKGKRLTIKES